MSSKRPHCNAVRDIIKRALADPDVVARVYAGGEPVDYQRPSHRDLAELTDDCYAADDALVRFRRGGQVVGSILLMPYEAEDADEIAVDWSANAWTDAVLDDTLFAVA